MEEVSSYDVGDEMFALPWGSKHYGRLPRPDNAQNLNIYISLRYIANLGNKKSTLKSIDW